MPISLRLAFLRAATSYSDISKNGPCIEKVTLKILPGTDIADACTEAHYLARLWNCDVQFEFNKEMINISAASDPQLVAKAYYIKVCDRSNDLKGANLKNARWDDCTVWPKGIGPLPKEQS